MRSRESQEGLSETPSSSASLSEGPGTKVLAWGPQRPGFPERMGCIFPETESWDDAWTKRKLGFGAFIPS